MKLNQLHVFQSYPGRLRDTEGAETRKPAVCRRDLKRWERNKAIRRRRSDVHLISLTWNLKKLLECVLRNWIICVNRVGAKRFIEHCGQLINFCIYVIMKNIFYVTNSFLHDIYLIYVMYKFYFSDSLFSFFKHLLKYISWHIYVCSCLKDTEVSELCNI